MGFARKPSLQMTVLLVFMPVIIVFVSLSGLVTYHVAAEKLEQNAYSSINDTLAQTKSYLNDRLTALLTEMSIVGNDYEFISLLGRLEDDSYTVKPDDYISINRLLANLYASHYNTLDSVIVSLNRGKAVFVKKDYMSSQVNLNLTAYSRQANNPMAVYWRNLHPNNVVNNMEQERPVASMFKLVGKEPSEQKGIILFQLRESFFKDILANPKISSNGYLALISDDGSMSYKPVESRYRLHDDVLETIRERKDTTGTIEYKAIGGEQMVALYDTIAINKWKLVAVFPRHELLSQVAYMKAVSLSAIAIVAIVAILLSVLLARYVTKPIVKLTRLVNQIGEGNLDVQFDLSSRNEIGVLNKGIRDLIERVKELIRQVEAEQEQKRNAEFAVLQAQIRPHFLYNTLYSINQLCDMAGAGEAGRMVLALSNFFRIAISKGSEIIPLREELEHIENYLYIQQMRYVDDFRYEIRIDSHLLTCPIVKLTLQPIVENAIYHGVKLNREEGLIRIEAFDLGDDLLISVSDNGPGMAPERLSQLRQSLGQMDDSRSAFGFGIRNVHRRLLLQYGPGYGLKLDSEPGAGTTVWVRLRMQRENTVMEASSSCTNC